MSDGGAIASRERRISSAIRQWATGIPSRGHGRVVLGSTGAGVADLVRRGDPSDTYLVPAEEGMALAAEADHMLTFDGQFEHPGDRLRIRVGYEIELMDYLVTPFVSIAGPTIVSCLTSWGWRAFIEDADEARQTGVFTSRLASPSVVLADRSVIDAAIDRTSVEVNRLTVDATGAARYRLGGLVAGSAGSIDLHDQPPSMFLRADWEPPEAGEDVQAQLAARPWIRRYLTALRIAGGVQGDSWSISGFGESLTTQHSDRVHRSSGHLIIWRGDEYQLVLESGRRFSVSRDTAIAVDSLVESSSFDGAVAAARAAGITGPFVAQELDALCVRLAEIGVGIDLADRRDLTAHDGDSE